MTDSELIDTLDRFYMTIGRGAYLERWSVGAPIMGEFYWLAHGNGLRTVIADAAKEIEGRTKLQPDVMCGDRWLETGKP